MLQVVCANPSLAFAPVLLRQADGWNLLMLFWGSCLARGALHGLTLHWVKMLLPACNVSCRTKGNLGMS